VAFVPGESFHPCGGGKNTIRLNFSNATPENLREGTYRIARLLNEKVAEPVTT
jgi:2-aminoadipate transaminase